MTGVQTCALPISATAAFILFIFSFLFTLIYHPLGAKQSLYFGFEITMLFYSAASASAAGVAIWVLNRLPWFSKLQQWTLGKEIIAVLLTLVVIAGAIFLMGFLIEEPAKSSRWNWQTFLDSARAAFFIYILPFAFFSVSNYKYLLLQFESTHNGEERENFITTISIKSQLKKESLTFSSDSFIYAVSDGNYVHFHLLENGEIKRVFIRNSMNDVAAQLSDIPEFYRCHRGFIINLRMVASKKGNSSGYLLHLKHTDDTVPVSRQKAVEFEKQLSRVAKP